MAKFLLLVAVLAAVYFIWKGARIARPPKPEHRSASVEPMVRCANCGVYFPRNEAIEANDQLFCSEEHRLASRAGRREGNGNDER